MAISQAPGDHPLPSRTRISKACEECRNRKIRCDGNTPCSYCTKKKVECLVRNKARLRGSKRNQAGVAKSPASARAINNPAPSQSEETIDDSHATASETDSARGGCTGPTSQRPLSGSAPFSSSTAQRSIHDYSVAATHHTSPSRILQVYYGPSSNFTLFHLIHLQVEGHFPASEREGVEEASPSLDRFKHRKLFFGDLGDGTPNVKENSFLIVDPGRIGVYLEKFLSTYWHIIPVVSKATYRRWLAQLVTDPSNIEVDSPESISLMVALCTGANMENDEAMGDFFLQKAKMGIVQLDEVVNVHMVERAKLNALFLYLGMAVRRAVATGLHKGAPSCRSQSSEEIAYHETLFWCLYFLETWGCFTMGRPSSVPEPDPSLPLPKEGSFLNALVKLSKIMKDCVSSIYMARHDSIVPVWHAATEIKGRLQRLAEDELKELAFGAGESFDSTETRGSQAFLSAMYHHVIILTFRPFIIMRTKLRNEMAKKKPQSSKTLQQLLPWLDRACDDCIEASRNTIGFLAGACAADPVCQKVHYFGFFIEGAAYLLLLDMLQDAQSAEKNKAWILTGLDCMRLIVGNYKGTGKQCAVTVAAIEQMLHCVFPTGATNTGEVNKPHPDVRRADDVRQRPPTTRAHSERELPQQPPLTTWPGPGPAFDDQHAPAWIYPSMPFGPGFRSQPTDSPVVLPDARPTDGAGMEFLSDEAGLDLSFGNTDIEAFLSLDPNLTFDFGL